MTKPPLKKQKRARPLSRGESITLDGYEYKNATFVDSIIVWNGGDFHLENVRFLGTRNFRTDNETIVSTIDTLKILGFLDKDFADSWKRDTN